MSCMSVRYTVKEGRGDENQRLIEQVFGELAEHAPAGLRYSAFRLEDGVTFVHVVSHQSAEVRERFRALPAFQRFLAGIKERCEVAPVSTPLSEVGTYDSVASHHATTAATPA
jgi:hypothetical protein